MKPYVYKSSLGVQINDFIKQKQASGYPYYSSSLILYRFDTFIAEIFPQTGNLTKEICMAWLRAKPNEHPNGLLRRITPIRQLGKYLNGLGYDAYILPGHIPNRQIRYEAHIYTEKELKAFFVSIDTCSPSPFSPTRCYVIPMLFRILYCCGLRSSEARLLNKNDVNLETGKITIRESKGWKARIVYMSSDLLKLCCQYSSIMDTILPLREAFFPNKEGKYFSRSSINYWFHEFWDILPEARKLVGNPARVHDFRHSYVVNRLNQWVKEKRDINALYPYLSEYMGHTNFADTDYYLSLVEKFYPIMEEKLTSVNNDILPEVCHGEE